MESGSSALNQFGPMAVTVLEEWGVCNCRDFGEIVFNMVEIDPARQNGAGRNRDDFHQGY